MTNAEFRKNDEARIAKYRSRAQFVIRYLILARFSYRKTGFLIGKDACHAADHRLADGAVDQHATRRLRQTRIRVGIPGARAGLRRRALRSAAGARGRRVLSQAARATREGRITSPS